MNFSAFLDISGSFHGQRRRSDEFELPEKRNIFRSTRFGDHAFDMDQEFLMIVPLRDASCRSAVSAREVPSQFVKKESDCANARVLISHSFSREECWRSLLGKLVNAFLGCKAHAVSFFW